MVVVGTSVPLDVSGPLHPFASGFRVELLELGYRWTAVRERMRLMAELSSWIAACGLEPVDLTASLVEGFSEAARARHPGKRWCSPASERALLAYLRGVGLVAPPEETVGVDPVARLIVQFVEYLVRERGLRAGSASVYEYKRTARLFLAGRIGPDGGGLDRGGAGCREVERRFAAEDASRRACCAAVGELRSMHGRRPSGFRDPRGSVPARVTGGRSSEA